MGKIIKYLLIGFIYILTINQSYGNLDSPDRDRDNDRNDRQPSPVTRFYKGIIDISENITGNVNRIYSFDSNCNAEIRNNPKYINKTEPLKNLNEKIHVCESHGTGKKICHKSITSSDDSDFNNPTETITIGVSTKDLIGEDGGYARKNFNIPLKRDLGGDDTIYISTFTPKVNIEINSYKRIKCEQEVRKEFKGKDSKGNPIYINIPTGKQIVTEKKEPKPTIKITGGDEIKIGAIPAEIEIKVNDDNCIKDGDLYSCYANESLKMNLKLKKEGSPKINNLKFYTLTESGKNCIVGENKDCPFVSKELKVGDFYVTNDWFKKAGTYTIEFIGEKIEDGKAKNNSNLQYIRIRIIPNPNYLVSDNNSSLNQKFSSRLVNNPYSTDGKAYANLKDEYEYNFNITDKFGNVIGNEKVDLDYFQKEPNLDWLQNKRLVKNGENDLKVNLFSGQPGKFKENFGLKIKSWNPKGELKFEYKYLKIPKNGGEKEFKKIVDLEKIEVKNEKNKNWEGIPQIGKKQEYRLILKENNLNGAIISNGDIGLDKEKFDFKDKHFFNFFNVIKRKFNNITDNLGFTAILDAKNEEGIKGGIDIKTKNLNVSYDIKNNGRYGYANYKLTDKGINGCKVPTLGVKVLGSIQADGKANATTSSNTFTDITKADVAMNVKKNANILIKGRTRGSVVNGVKYVVDRNYEIESNINYETLIVKGNLIINRNVNTSNKKLGIIVLGGDIIVDKDVTEINAVIYADGSIKNKSGVNDSELFRTLDIKGSLFTKNTIGGAVSAGSDYILPGGEKTKNFAEAQEYDLNYLRKVPFDCNNPNDYYSVKIEYDPKVQVNPPKGFEIKK